MNIRAKRFNTTATLVLTTCVSALLATPAFAADKDASAMADHAKKGSITVTQSKVIDAAPDEVWSTVRDFDALSLWHPAVESSDIAKGENNKPGAQRHLTLSDGGTVDEQLISWDDAGMSYSYKILGGVLPVSNYVSTIAVEAEGDERSRLIWKGQFDPAEGQTADKAKTVITSVYDAGLNNVDTMMSGD
ncbi:SRPBCC family protein [Salinisphaera aquimarina]|uniref:SRPBCC family protein n=1 Tax=Salinisphaera aquimarina TaxID=2094031 RepID=A0ABV7ES47_9GAMM